MLRYPPNGAPKVETLQVGQRLRILCSAFGLLKDRAGGGWRCGFAGNIVGKKGVRVTCLLKQIVEPPKMIRLLYVLC